MDVQKSEQEQKEQAQQVQATEQNKEETVAPAEQPVREKTQEELDYEAGYYACCFRSH